MKLEDIEIHTGSPDFKFDEVRRLEARCEAPTMMSKAPTVEDVNLKLREMAAGLGANAVINVVYESGMSLTSFRSVRGAGLAVRKVSDDIPCPVCAETIKRAAKRCRFCQADLTTNSPEQATGTEPSMAPTPRRSISSPYRAQEPPLTSSDNPAGMIAVVIAVILGIFFLISIASQ